MKFVLRIKHPSLLSFAIENFPRSRVQYRLIKACHSVSFPSIFSGKMIFLMARLSHGNFDPQLNSAKMKVCIKICACSTSCYPTLTHSISSSTLCFQTVTGAGEARMELWVLFVLVSCVQMNILQQQQHLPQSQQPNTTLKLQQEPRTQDRWVALGEWAIVNSCSILL